MKTKSKTKNFKEIMMSDSDSEDDAVMDTVLVWKNNDTIIHAGSKLSNNTLTSKQPINILPKNMTTLRDRPYNFSRQNDVVNNSYMPRPRATSPLSDVRSHFRGFSQKSMADGTESMISDAPTNVSCAFDIALAIKGGQYTASEAKMITDAVMHKFGKRSIKSGRVKKRRVNKKDITKIVSVLLRALDNDNSDDKSTTSISSEECTSVRSEYPSYNGSRRNVSYAASLQNYPRNFDLSVTNNAHISNKINSSTYGSSKSENFKRKSFRNMYALGQPNANKHTLNSSFVSMPPPPTNIVPVNQTKNKTITNVVEPVVDKCKNKKNKTILPDSTEKNKEHKSPLKTLTKPVNSVDKDSDKRNHNVPQNNFGNCNMEPRTPEKVISYSKPRCNIDLLSLENNNVQKNTNIDEDLIFTKPQIPTRLSNNPTNDSNQTNIDENTSELTKSSFMRRKLFTQTLEITENRECRDTDHSRSNSPLVNIYANDKSKKSSYSMRNSIEDNNRTGQQLLDLVKKIVPAEDMKIITEEKNLNPTKNYKVNKKQIRSNSLEQLSDTFTDDEDIFLLRNKANDTCILKPPQNLNKTPISPPVNHDKAQNSINYYYISSSTLKLRNATQKVANIEPKQNKTKNGINKSRLGMNRKNVTTRKANLFWETDTENEADNTQNESIDYGKEESEEACEEELISDESKENKSIHNPEVNTNCNKFATSFESELDDLFRRNPEAYKNHMLKVIKESNPQSKPRMNLLIGNIEKCLDINNTLQASKDKNSTKLNHNNSLSRNNVKTNINKVKAGKDVKRNSPNTRSSTKTDSKKKSANSPSKRIIIKKKSLSNVNTIAKIEVKRNSPNTRSVTKNEAERNLSSKTEGKKSSSNICTKNKHEVERNQSNALSSKAHEAKRGLSNVKYNIAKHEVKRNPSKVHSNSKHEIQRSSSNVRPNNAKPEYIRSSSNIQSNLKNIKLSKQNGIKNEPANTNKQSQAKIENSFEDTPTLRPRKNRTVTPQSDNLNMTATKSKRTRCQRTNDSVNQPTPIRSKRNTTTRSYDNSIIVNSKRNNNNIVKCKSKDVLQELTPIRPKRSKAANLDDSFILTKNNKRIKYF